MLLLSKWFLHCCCFAGSLERDSPGLRLSYNCSRDRYRESYWLHVVAQIRHKNRFLKSTLDTPLEFRLFPLMAPQWGHLSRRDWSVVNVNLKINHFCRIDKHQSVSHTFISKIKQRITHFVNNNAMKTGRKLRQMTHR